MYEYFVLVDFTKVTTALNKHNSNDLLRLLGTW